MNIWLILLIALSLPFFVFLIAIVANHFTTTDEDNEGYDFNPNECKCKRKK